MSRFVQYLLNTFTSAVFGAQPAMEDDLASSFYDPDRYTPSIEAVFSVKESLFKNFHLPIELIDTIIDFAEYWPRTSTCRTGGELRVRAGQPDTENQFLLRSYPLGYIPNESTPTTSPMASAGPMAPAIVNTYPTIPATPWASFVSPFSKENTEYMKSRWASASQIRGEYPCRKIVFTLVSHDQGWGGNAADKGTYRGSFTWFDVGKETIHTSEEDSAMYAGTPNVFPTIFPNYSTPELVEGDSPLLCTVETYTPTVHSSSSDSFEHPLMPTSRCLQKNLTATQEPHQHKIVWSCQDRIFDPDHLAAQALENKGRGRETGSGDYVREMKVGDVVTVWGKARFPGWVNMIETVQIDVYWAV